MVSAGTNFNFAVPVIGMLQELRVQQGKPVPFYLDSKTTVFVASSDSAVKKSVWLIRRVTVVEEGVVHGYTLSLCTLASETWRLIHSPSV